MGWRLGRGTGRRVAAAVAFAAGLCARTLPARAEIAIGPSFRIHPSAVTQTETFIVRHPLDPALLFASANTIDLGTGFVSEGIYVSTDAGATWAGSDTCSGAPISFHRGDPGIAIDRNGRFILIRLGSIPGLYSHYSTDQGRTWSSQRTVATNDQDRASLVSDGDPTSPFCGRSYAVWVRFSPPYPVLFADTDDGAASWSAPAPVNSPPQRCQGGEVAIGPGGSVNVCWAGVVGVSPFTEDDAGFARSTDGGASWSVLENAFDTDGIAGVFPSKSNIRVNGLPRLDVDASAGPREGWIYVVTAERDLAPAGADPDVVLHRSTDGGATWSAGVRVNQDPLDNGKYQFFPVVHVDEGGGVNVLYYDDRTTTADSASVFLSRSTDGGETWTDTEVADHHFRPAPIGGLGQGYQGDNIGLTSLGDSLWPVWMDNSSGIYQVWTCPISLGGNGGIRIFPNPFYPRTTLEFRLVRREAVRVDIVDVSGRLWLRPVEEILEPGVHRVLVDATGWPNGVYVARLRSETASAAGKLVLAR